MAPAFPAACTRTMCHARGYICHPGVPAFAGGMPAGTTAYHREHLIRLTPGLPRIVVWIRFYRYEATLISNT